MTGTSSVPRQDVCVGPGQHSALETGKGSERTPVVLPSDAQLGQPEVVLSVHICVTAGQLLL